MIPANHPVRRRLAGAAASTLLAGGVLLAAALPAGAHVHVEADHPTTGGFSVLTFRVPNESDTAGTVKVAVTLPADTPFLSVSTKPVPGWTADAAQRKLPSPVDVDGTTITTAIQEVTWTADKGVQIGPGEYQEFAISVGPLPEPTTIVLPAVQTYSDGKVVSWDQKTPASGEEPEHPAPEFAVAAAANGEETHAADGSTPATPQGSDADRADGTSAGDSAAQGSGDTAARVLGGLGLVLGAAALGVAVVALRRKGAA